MFHLNTHFLGLVEGALERDKRLAIVKAAAASIVNHGARVACGQVLNEENLPVDTTDHTPTRRNLSNRHDVTILQPTNRPKPSGITSHVTFTSAQNTILQTSPAAQAPHAGAHHPSDGKQTIYPNMSNYPFINFVANRQQQKPKDAF
ncbi:hypothetical protein MUP79_06355 [Candidatus Bathyarchaeota archaeon]|nr:hypothetical protein [Candidatus Bathyarchaeota archaeon]